MAFLNGDLEEEVYMKQPEGFSSSDGDHLVCKLKKSIYVSLKTPWINVYTRRLVGVRIWVRHLMSLASTSIETDYEGDKFNLNQCPKNDFEREQMKNISYTSVVRSLMYAQVYTRPNIAFVVGMLGRYQSNLGIDHWRAAKKVMRYLQGTKNCMLIYRQTNNLEVISYSDSNFAGCVDSRKSTSRYVFIMASGAVSWRSVSSP
ncbi:secreted RxLR effector protein 161-like [Pistacia vera]|uniref:secreted RxLR effector protein 161-like n=1 Tax=Pistacia vera TaxID=55513 RepID=UPI001262C703|nr:secreted RxLR effector protein 161-like [Pistacia vera]